MKPAFLPALLSEVTAFLTIVAALPYELGDVANLLPPEQKKLVAVVGAVATLALRLIKRWLEEREKSKAPPVPAALGILLAAFLLQGCAGSGPNGEWTAEDSAATTRALRDASETYYRLRYPDRPVYPPGAPFPVYPPQ